MEARQTVNEFAALSLWNLWFWRHFCNPSFPNVQSLKTTDFSSADHSKDDTMKTISMPDQAGYSIDVIGCMKYF